MIDRLLKLMEITQQALTVKLAATDHNSNSPGVPVKRLTLPMNHDRMGCAELPLDGQFVHSRSIPRFANKAHRHVLDSATVGTALDVIRTFNF